jgi:hypothetical protein
MKVTFQPVCRNPRWPIAPLVALAIWLGLVAVVEFLGQRSDVNPQTCLFKSVIHIPCPTCGSTRLVMNLLHGQVWQALACNPMMFLLLLGSATWGICRLGLGRAIRLELSRNQRLAAWIVVTCLFVTNWIYVIRCVG